MICTIHKIKQYTLNISFAVSVLIYAFFSKKIYFKITTSYLESSNSINNYSLYIINTGYNLLSSKAVKLKSQLSYRFYLVANKERYNNLKCNKKKA